MPCLFSEFTLLIEKRLNAIETIASHIPPKADPPQLAPVKELWEEAVQDQQKRKKTSDQLDLISQKVVEKQRERIEDAIATERDYENKVRSAVEEIIGKEEE